MIGAKNWSLFMDFSKQSMKAVLLHITNVYAPIPIAHCTVMPEKYVNIGMLLQKIKYDACKWQICGNLKIITILLGQNSGFTKHLCCLCLWDSRDRANHYKKNWPTRSSFAPGRRNIIHNLLVNPLKILISSLHIR